MSHEDPKNRLNPDEARVQADTENINKKYAQLSGDQQKLFPQAQAEISQMIADHVSGKKPMDISLIKDPDTLAVIGQLEELHKANPGLRDVKPGKILDQKKLDNLVQRLSIDKVERGGTGEKQKTAETPKTLTPEQQKAAKKQQKALEIISGHFTGKSKIPDGVLKENEAAILLRMEKIYQEAKTKSPDQPVNFDEFFKMYPGAKDIYANLMHRLPLAVQEHGHKQQDQVKADEIRGKLGIKSQEQKDISETLSEEDILKIKNEAGENYKQNNGDVNNDLLMTHIDPEIGRNFDAHGIAKVSIYHQLDSLLNLLQKGIDPNRPFHSAPLELRPEDAKGAQTAGGIATRNGSFIVLGEMGKSITESGIKHVLVNDAFYRAIEKLSQTFPQVEFIRADQANEKLGEIAKRKNEKG